MFKKTLLSLCMVFSLAHASPQAEQMIQSIGDEVGTLRWTIPGGAAYKHAIPTSNLHPKNLTFVDRLRMLWNRWQWVVITGYAVLAAANLFGRTDAQPAEN